MYHFWKILSRYFLLIWKDLFGYNKGKKTTSMDKGSHECPQYFCRDNLTRPLIDSIYDAEAGNFYIQETANLFNKRYQKNKNSIEKYNTVIKIGNLFYKIAYIYVFTNRNNNGYVFALY